MVTWTRNATDLWTTETLSGLVLARVGRDARPRAGHLELRVLVVRLVRYEHPDFAPPVEKHDYCADPDHQDQDDDRDLDPTYLDNAHAGDVIGDTSTKTCSNTFAPWIS